MYTTTKLNWKLSSVLKFEFDYLESCITFQVQENSYAKRFIDKNGFLCFTS